MNEGEAKPFTAGDVRFTTRDGALHAILLAWPNAPVTIAALGRSAMPDVRIERVRLIGGGPLAVDHDDAGLHLSLPPAGAGDIVPVVRIEGRGLVSTEERRGGKGCVRPFEMRWSAVH